MPALSPRPTTYVYFDGESHYHRTEEAWRKINGPIARLEMARLRTHPDGGGVLVIPDARVFLTRPMVGEIRVVYFTSVVGSDDDEHSTKVRLREFGVESVVVREEKKLAKRREDALSDSGLIEKPKGVDAALAVRVLEDAYHDNFDMCRMYTSDVDI